MSDTEQRIAAARDAARAREGWTPLACLLDALYDPAALDRMLADGADPEARSGAAAETALHVATRRRRLDAVTRLIDHGVDVNARTSGGKTAYAHARRRTFDEVADVLAARGADTSLAPADTLAIALMHDDLDAARATIGAAPDLVRDAPPEEARVLADLAGRSSVDAMTLLLDHGADIAAPGLDGGTALHQAAWFGAPASADLLIARGAPLESADNDHHSTPLGWLAHGSRCSGGADERQDAYVRIATALLAAGARVGDDGGRALMTEASPAVAAVLRAAAADR